MGMTCRCARSSTCGPARTSHGPYTVMVTCRCTTAPASTARGHKFRVRVGDARWWDSGLKFERKPAVEYEYCPPKTGETYRYPDPISQVFSTPACGFPAVWLGRDALISGVVEGPATIEGPGGGLPQGQMAPLDVAYELGAAGSDGYSVTLPSFRTIAMRLTRKRPGGLAPAPEHAGTPGPGELPPGVFGFPQHLRGRRSGRLGGSAGMPRPASAPAAIRPVRPEPAADGVGGLQPVVLRHRERAAPAPGADRCRPGRGALGAARTTVQRRLGAVRRRRDGRAAGTSGCARR